MYSVLRPPSIVSMWPGGLVVKEECFIMRCIAVLVSSLMLFGSSAVAEDSARAEAMVVPFSGDYADENGPRHVELKRVLVRTGERSFDDADYSDHKLSSEERNALSRELREITDGGVYEAVSESSQR